MQPTDRIANWMPLYHDGGLIAGFVQPLVQGLELSILSPMDWVRDPVLLLRAITADRATLCWLPNFAYAFMATRIPDRRLEGIDLSSMRAFINTAEPVRVASAPATAPVVSTPAKPAARDDIQHGGNTLAITQSDPTSRSPCSSIVCAWHATGCRRAERRRADVDARPVRHPRDGTAFSMPTGVSSASAGSASSPSAASAC